MPTYLEKPSVTDDVVQAYSDFARVRENHQRQFVHFNSSFDGQTRNWQQYIDYSFKKFNQFVEIPQDAENYEVHLALPNIRNKLMAILARLSAQRMKSEIHAQNVEQNFDRIVSKYLESMLEWSDDTSQQDVVNFYWMLETAMKGTGILMEDYYKHVREIKDIKVYDATTGQSKWKKRTETEDGCHSFIIPLEEFYVWNMRMNAYDLQKQYKTYWVTLMDWQDFQYCFRRYPAVKKNEVKPGGYFSEADKAFYNDYLSTLPEKTVEVMREWCKEADTFAIYANGTRLTEPDNPIPFKHKNYPQVAAVYEPIAHDFFPGKSLPDKMGNISDAIDQTFNDLFNRNQIEMKAPLVAKKGSTMQNSVWRPDTIIEYTGERPEVLKVSTSTQDTDRVFNILNEQLNLSSVSPTGQGQTGSGSTAREVVIAQENANELMNMFLRFMEWAEVRRVDLRLPNILQFLTTPVNVKEVAGDESAEMVDTYRTLFQHGVELESGEYGTREIRIKPDMKITPPQVLEKQFNPAHEIYEVGAEFIRQIKFFSKVVPNSSVKLSKALIKALDQEYVQTMVQLFPDLVDRMKLAGELTEAFDKSPDKLLKKPEEAGPPDQMAQLEQILNGGGQPAGAPQSNELMKAVKPMPQLSMTQ